MKEVTLREAREGKRLSLRKAAELLGVTHAYLSGLELGHKPLRPDRREQLAKLYGVKDPFQLKQPLPEDKGDFAEWLHGQIKWWDSRFVLPMIPACTSTITDLYVSPSFTDSEGTVESDELIKRFAGDDDNRAMIITGGLGTGKSFYLRSLALELPAILSKVNSQKKFIPFLISLGDFTLNPGSIVQSVVHYYQGLGYPGSMVQFEQFFKQTLHRGQALLLFDGLDEIFEQAERSETLALLQKAFENELRENGNKIVITGQESVFVGQKSNAVFVVYRINRWHPGQMHAGCSRWNWSRDGDAEAFWKLLQSHEYLFELAKWPLLFHLFTTLYSAGGAGAFQDFSGICEACCQVLETSWNDARRIFVGSPNAKNEISGAGVPPWLKWRHFLIHLMERELQDALKEERAIDTAFTPTTVQDAWESFLQRRGLNPDSIDFARFEDVIKRQNRLGPLVVRMRPTDINALGELKREFAFVDPVFGYLYLGKALLNSSETLPAFLLSHVRNPDWSQAIPFVIQELLRSERTHENALGARLIELLLSSDDILELERKHRIGHWGLFTAMRGIAPSNISHFWDTIVVPSLSVYLTSNFGRDVSLGYRILSDFSASKEIHAFFKAAVSSDQQGGEKWRVLSALVKLGEEPDTIVGQIIEDIETYTTREGALSSDSRIQLRRLLWSLQEIGKLLSLEDYELAARRSPQRTHIIQRIRGAIAGFVERSFRDFSEEMQAGVTTSACPWDVLTVLLFTQAQLHYKRDLEATLLEFCGGILQHFDYCFSAYGRQHQLVQFLKAASAYGPYLLNRKVSNSLVGKLRTLLSRGSHEEHSELLVVAEQFEGGDYLSLDESSYRVRYEKVYGEVNQRRLEEWFQLIRNSNTNLPCKFTDVANAVWGLRRFSAEVDGVDASRNALRRIPELLTFLNAEEQRADGSGDEERYFTLPFNGYGSPLYDHVYTCICELAQLLPVTG